MTDTGATKVGRKSLSELSGEDTFQVKVLLTKTQRDYVMSRDIPAASFIRYLIEASIQVRIKTESGDDLTNVNLRELMDKVEEIRVLIDSHIDGTPSD